MKKLVLGGALDARKKTQEVNIPDSNLSHLSFLYQNSRGFACFDKSREREEEDSSAVLRFKRKSTMPSWGDDDDDNDEIGAKGTSPPAAKVRIIRPTSLKFLL